MTLQRWTKRSASLAAAVAVSAASIAAAQAPLLIGQPRVMSQQQQQQPGSELFEWTGTVGFRVGGIGPSGAIVVDLGPTLHLWKSTPETRTRVGGLLAGTYDWAVSERFSGAIRIESILSKSWFDEADLPPEYRRQVTWRYGWGVGLRYRL